MSVNPIITGGSPLVTTVSRLKWNISNPQNTRKMLEPVIYTQLKEKIHNKKIGKIFRISAIKKFLIKMTTKQFFIMKKSINYHQIVDIEIKNFVKVVESVIFQ